MQPRKEIYIPYGSVSLALPQITGKRSCLSFQVLSPGELVLLFIRVLDGLMKIRGAPDRIYRPTVEAISTSVRGALRTGSGPRTGPEERVSG